MRPLSAFLGKFRSLEPPERVVKAAASAACKHVLGVDISPAHIRIVRDSVHIDVPSVIKSEMKLRENEIIEDINARLTSSKRRLTRII